MSQGRLIVSDPEICISFII